MSQVSHGIVAMQGRAAIRAARRPRMLCHTWIALPLVFAGCVRIPIVQQQDLSRPNMVFESQGAFASRPALFSQTEPGSAASSGGQSAGCTACR